MSDTSLAAAPTIDTAPTDKAHANQHLETAQKPDFSNKSLDGILKDGMRKDGVLSSSMDGMRKVSPIILKNGVHNSKAEHVAAVIESKYLSADRFGCKPTTLHDASAQGPAYDAQRDGVRFERVRATEPVLTVQLYEQVQPGSSMYTLSDQVLEVAARRVRVVDIQLTDVRASGRAAVAAASRRRVKIEDDSLLKIRAEMPTEDDEWVVERVAEYRMLHGVDQWLVKWKNYEEARNTWEPWEHLGSEVQEEARRVKDDSLPRDEAGLAKVPVARLKDALQARGLETTGRKPELVVRLCGAFAAGFRAQA